MINILLATYNGAAFLAEQLASLFAQTIQDFCVFVADDGSNDDTCSIITAFKAHHKKRLIILPRRRGGPRGAMGNFAYLLANTPPADYIFFCDQDDVWLPQKLELTLKKFRQYEENGYSGPLLVHSAHLLSDEHLKPMRPTLASLTVSEKARASHSFGALLQQNVVTGCTMAINRALFSLLKPLPEEALMHDYWLALLAAACGKIAFITTPTLYYRQHGRNSIGGAYRLNLPKLLKLREKCNHDLQRRARQAAAFLQQYGDIMPLSARETALSFSRLPELPYKEKLKILNKYHLWSSKFLTNIELLLMFR